MSLTYEPSAAEIERRAIEALMHYVSQGTGQAKPVVEAHGTAPQLGGDEPHWQLSWGGKASSIARDKVCGSDEGHGSNIQSSGQILDFAIPHNEL